MNWAWRIVLAPLIQDTLLLGKVWGIWDVNRSHLRRKKSQILQTIRNPRKTTKFTLCIRWYLQKSSLPLTHPNLARETAKAFPLVRYSVQNSSTKTFPWRLLWEKEQLRGDCQLLFRSHASARQGGGGTVLRRPCLRQKLRKKEKAIQMRKGNRY